MPQRGTTRGCVVVPPASHRWGAEVTRSREKTRGGCGAARTTDGPSAENLYVFARLRGSLYQEVRSELSQQRRANAIRNGVMRAIGGQRPSAPINPHNPRGLVQSILYGMRNAALSQAVYRLLRTPDRILSIFTC
jgi:hypothetical protein